LSFFYQHSMTYMTISVRSNDSSYPKRHVMYDDRQESLIINSYQFSAKPHQRRRKLRKTTKKIAFSNTTKKRANAQKANESGSARNRHRLKLFTSSSLGWYTTTRRSVIMAKDSTIQLTEQLQLSFYVLRGSLKH